MVERQQARRAYEDFLHRKQDPALLENAAGNEFRARIFPIPANGVKEIIISYSQELARAESVYTLPLRGLPKIDDLSVTAFVGQGGAGGMKYAPTKLVRKKWAPDRDFAVTLKSGVASLRSGNIAVARIAPKMNVAIQKLRGVAILFDTSASRAPGFSMEVARLAKVVSALRKFHGDDMRLVVATFDQQVTPIFNGKVSNFSGNHTSAVLARRPLGASDLNQALAWLGKTRGFDRAILFSDGIATAGPTGADELLETARGLKGRVTRLDAIAIGGIRDEPLLTKLVRGPLESNGVVLDGGLAPAMLAKRVSQATVSDIKVAVPGASWVWPETLNGVQPGDEFLVYAHFRTAASANGKVKFQLSGSLTDSISVTPAQASAPLLTRSSVSAQIARLNHLRAKLGPKAKDARADLKKQIIALSIKHRVLSKFTALLVLETDNDYKRFKIDRNALTDILRVGATGVETFHRGKPVTIARDAKRPAKQKPAGKKGKISQDQSGDDGKRGSKDEKKKQESGQEAPEKVTTADKSVDEGTKNLAVAKPPARTQPVPPPAPPTSDPSPSPDVEESDDDSNAGDSRSVNGASGNSVSDEDEKERKSPPPLKGKLAEVMKLIAKKQTQQAVLVALKWRTDKPGDVMALVALGEALEANGNLALASRVYGSIIDLFPSRADMRRFAGQRLERLGQIGQTLASDSFRKAVAQRPDHLTSHRLLAYSLVRETKYEAAFNAAEIGVKRNYPSGRFAGGKRALREDLGIIAAAWLSRDQSQKPALLKRLKAVGARLATKPSTRFIMTWETDANDVDFHIYDAKGGHASYSNKRLRSGGELFADVTNGYGPEVFAINGPASAGPYRVKIHYYSRGPMGYGMGRLEILKHDGNGKLSAEFRPYVVMNDGAYVNLGSVR